jgi:hypothetical protein
LDIWKVKICQKSKKIKIFWFFVDFV